MEKTTYIHTHPSLFPVLGHASSFSVGLQNGRSLCGHHYVNILTVRRAWKCPGHGSWRGLVRGVGGGKGETSLLQDTGSQDSGASS